jgi:hypothetical protein
MPMSTLILLTTLASPAPLAPWEAADAALGRIGRVLDGGVHRYSWPRTDLVVTVAGTRLEPALALGSWAGFVLGSDGRAMTMGDLVVLPGEVGAVLRALQAGGLDVLAIHNHLAGESPQVLYVHFGGHGDAAALAKALRSALEKTATPLAGPAALPQAPTPAEQAAFDRVQQILGRKGSAAGPVLQIGVPRSFRIVEEGREVPPALGMSTALNFQVAGTKVLATGDFVLQADEVNPVLRELQAHGIEPTALHSHMLRESPRLFFMHFWAMGEPASIAEGLKAALGKTAP